jgi:hypothetical protein
MAERAKEIRIQTIVWLGDRRMDEPATTELAAVGRIAWTWALADRVTCWQLEVAPAG